MSNIALRRWRVATALLCCGLLGPGGAAFAAPGPPGQDAAPDADPAAAVRIFAAVLREAQEGTERLLDAYPGREDLESVRRQLGQVAIWTRKGQPPASWQSRRLSFGAIAAREIEPLDSYLARRLEALTYFLAHWPGTAAER